MYPIKVSKKTPIGDLSVYRNSCIGTIFKVVDGEIESLIDRLSTHALIQTVYVNPGTTLYTIYGSNCLVVVESAPLNIVFGDQHTGLWFSTPQGRPLGGYNLKIPN